MAAAGRCGRAATSAARRIFSPAWRSRACANWWDDRAADRRLGEALRRRLRAGCGLPRREQGRGVARPARQVAGARHHRRHAPPRARRHPGRHLSLVPMEGRRPGTRPGRTGAGAGGRVCRRGRRGESAGRDGTPGGRRSPLADTERQRADASGKRRSTPPRRPKPRS